MGLGAILVIGAEQEFSQSVAPRRTEEKTLLAEPLACVDILGRSTLERTIKRLARNDVRSISLLVAEEKSFDVEPFLDGCENVDVQVVADVFSAIRQKVKSYSQKGIEHSFIASASVYAETDLRDLFYFHREAQRTATRALDREGLLDLWVVDCAKAEHSDFQFLLAGAQEDGPSYFIREYVTRLTHPRDLHRLVLDALSGRSAMRPSGQEIKPGIWIDAGAEIDRRARIVAPAYIGRGSKVREDTLVTRFSSIEKDCYIDCGSVIENSAILANTRMGICLEVRHAVANGNKLLSLEHEVLLEISDPCVMRFNRPVRQGVKHSLGWDHQMEGQQIVADIKPQQPPTLEPWQLGADPIRG